MIYKATVETMRTLTGEQCRRLILAMGDFAFHEKDPDFTDDGKLTSLWPLISDGLSRDDAQYVKKGVGKLYGAYKTAMKKHNLVPLDREEWESLGCPTYTQFMRGEIPANAGQSPEIAQRSLPSLSDAKHSLETLSDAKQEEANAKQSLKMPYSYPNTNSLTNPSTNPNAYPHPHPSTTASGAVAAVAGNDPAFARVMREVLNYIPELSPMRADILKSYCDTLGADVCVMAIYEARDASVNGDKKGWKYIEGILRRCERENIRSLEAWNQAETERKQGKNNKNQNPNDFLSDFRDLTEIFKDDGE